MGGGGSKKVENDRAEAKQDEIAEYKANKEPMAEPWRKYPADIFLQASKDRLLNKIYECSPPEPCQAINLMVIGDIGTGKSSFINTLITVFRNNGQQSTLASAHGRLHEVTLMTFRNGKKLRIYDCRGVHSSEWNNTHYSDDLIKAVDGCIKKGYEFKKDSGIQKDSKFNNRNPTISDRMHCVLYVTQANQDQIEHSSVLYNVRRHVDDLDIPLRLILTKADQLNLCGYNGDLSGIFQSRQVKLKVEMAIKNFGLQDCQILPIVNYGNGLEQNITQDVLALLTIDNILQEALSYIKNETQE